MPVHATAVVLDAAARAFGGPEGIAVLLLGDPGSGKSETALRLIAAGGRLLSDDQTALFVEDGRLWAEAPAGARGLIEVRGAGIIALDAAKGAPVALAVHLVAEGAIPRLPEPAPYRPPAPLKPEKCPPLARFRAFEAALPAKIAAAAAAAAAGRFEAGIGGEKSP